MDIRTTNPNRRTAALTKGERQMGSHMDYDHANIKAAADALKEQDDFQVANPPTVTVSETPFCELCGEPMPAGEEMFKIHGYSGPCPKTPLPTRKPRLFVRTPGTDDMLCLCGGPELTDAIAGLKNILACGDSEGAALPIELEIRQMTDEEVALIVEV